MDVELEVIMEHYVIYQRPRDYPNHAYVCRKWSVYRGVPEPVADPIPTLMPSDVGLRCLRAVLEGWGLTRLVRDPNDDPAILEIWI